MTWKERRKRSATAQEKIVYKRKKSHHQCGSNYQPIFSWFLFQIDKTENKGIIIDIY